MALPGEDSELDPLSQQEAAQIADEFLAGVNELAAKGVDRREAWVTQEHRADDQFRIQFGEDAFIAEKARASAQTTTNAVSR